MGAKMCVIELSFRDGMHASFRPGFKVALDTPIEALDIPPSAVYSRVGIMSSYRRVQNANWC